MWLRTVADHRHKLGEMKRGFLVGLGFCLNVTDRFRTDVWALCIMCVDSDMFSFLTQLGVLQRKYRDLNV